MEERMTNYIKSLSEEERLLFCRKQISIVIKSFRVKEKSESAELNFNGGHINRTARNRGGRLTSLSAKAINDMQDYLKGIEDLKLIVKYL